MPSARAASAWPGSTALMPERTASQTNAAVYTVSASTANRKNEVRTPIAGNPNVTQTNTNTRGVLRTMFTQLAPAKRSTGTGHTRIAASSVPSTNDTAPDSTNSLTVIQNARSRSGRLSLNTCTVHSPPTANLRATPPISADLYSPQCAFTR